VYAANFKSTIAKAMMILIEDYNIPRDKISVIWGGSAAFGGSDEKYSQEEIHNVLAGVMRGDDIPVSTLKEISTQLQHQASGLGDIPTEYRLGTQSKTARWNEIKRFQSGRSEFCFFSFKAGGAGLSLHQNLPTLRPRKQYTAPTYNEMEMLQAEGRTARLTSLSDTESICLVYRNTIEIPVLQRVTSKRRSLNAVIAHGQGVSKASDDVIGAETQHEVDKILSLLGKPEDQPSVEEQDLEDKAAEDMFNEIDDDDDEID
jgi:hypothetical protein